MLALALSLFPIVASKPLNSRANTLQPGQPTRVDDSHIGGFALVGQSGVSAQQLFLGNDHQVYIIDKVEANPLPINNHPAWATVYDLRTNIPTPLEVYTNAFCAGGGQLADGRWLNIGGNKAVEPGAVTNDDPSSQAGNNANQDADGRTSARTITPADGAQWGDDHTLDLCVFLDS